MSLIKIEDLDELNKKKILQIWIKNKSINPLTKKAIKENGNIYKKYVLLCIEYGLLEKNFYISEKTAQKEIAEILKIKDEQMEVSVKDGGRIDLIKKNCNIIIEIKDINDWEKSVGQVWRYVVQQNNEKYFPCVILFNVKIDDERLKIVKLVMEKCMISCLIYDHNKKEIISLIDYKTSLIGKFFGYSIINELKN